MSQTTTAAPRLENSIAAWCPIPRPAPVTNATLPLTRRTLPGGVITIQTGRPPRRHAHQNSEVFERVP